MGNIMTVMIGKTTRYSWGDTPYDTYYVCWGNYQDFYDCDTKEQWEAKVRLYDEATHIATFLTKEHAEKVASSLCDAQCMEYSKGGIMDITGEEE